MFWLWVALGAMALNVIIGLARYKRHPEREENRRWFWLSLLLLLVLVFCVVFV